MHKVEAIADAAAAAAAHTHNKLSVIYYLSWTTKLFAAFSGIIVEVLDTLAGYLSAHDDDGDEYTYS